MKKQGSNFLLSLKAIGYKKAWLDFMKCYLFPCKDINFNLPDVMRIFTTNPDEDLWELLLIWTTFTIEEIIILYQQNAASQVA